MTVDRATVEASINDARAGFDKVQATTPSREQVFQAFVTGTFLAFAATSHLLKITPREQLQAINTGLDTVGRVLAQRGASEGTRYGSRSKCADITRDMVQVAIDQARNDVGMTDIMLHKGKSRQGLLSRRLMDFCVTSKLLNPDRSAQARMMSMANELVAEMLAAEGPLGRNVIKIH